MYRKGFQQLQSHKTLYDDFGPPYIFITIGNLNKIISLHTFTFINISTGTTIQEEHVACGAGTGEEPWCVDTDVVTPTIVHAAFVNIFVSHQEEHNKL